VSDLAKRHQQFQDLHRAGCFVIPNPWDAGSARMMAAAGARALATTSSGFAFTLGRPDMGTVTRDEALAHAEAIVAATPLPVSGDFENGFRDDPDGVAETVRLAAEAGLSGCSIEDTLMVEGNPAYEFGLAVEQIHLRQGIVPEQAFGGCRAPGRQHASGQFLHLFEQLERTQHAGGACFRHAFDWNGAWHKDLHVPGGEGSRPW